VIRTDYLERHGFRQLPDGRWSNGAFTASKRAAMRYQKIVNEWNDRHEPAQPARQHLSS
jgi:hypothetical protein